MQMKNLYVRREEYGKDKGKLSGKVEFSSELGDVHLNLDEEMSRAIVQICSEAIVRAAQEVALNLTRTVIESSEAEQIKLLEDNFEDPHEPQF